FWSSWLPTVEVTSGRSLLPSENFARRCKNEDSFRASRRNQRASITAKAQRSARASSCRGSASPSTGSSATLGDGLAEACQRSPPSYDDGAADGTAALAGRKIHASVGGEAASSASVPARSANNGPP